jgi:predicted nucleic acid-binding Zn ribbon protein
MKKRPASSSKPIGLALDELIQSLGIQPKLKEYEAVLQWETAVGDQIARVTTAMRITQGTLFVRVTTGVWRYELTLRKKEIVQRLNTVLGSEVVRDIKFQ